MACLAGLAWPLNILHCMLSVSICLNYKWPQLLFETCIRAHGKQTCKHIASVHKILGATGYLKRR